MRLRVGITEAGKNIPVLDNLTAAIPTAMVLSKGKKYIGGTEAFVGKATIEGELADSQTGELLAAGVDRRGWQVRLEVVGALGRCRSGINLLGEEIPVASLPAAGRHQVRKA